MLLKIIKDLFYFLQFIILIFDAGKDIKYNNLFTIKVSVLKNGACEDIFVFMSLVLIYLSVPLGKFFGMVLIFFSGGGGTEINIQMRNYFI